MVVGGAERTSMVLEATDVAFDEVDEYDDQAEALEYTDAMDGVGEGWWW